MTWGEYFIVLGSCMVTMLACRVLPLFLLKGRSLPDAVERALGFIPSAAFAALVANDLLSPGMFAAGIWPAAMPLVASAVVVMVEDEITSWLRGGRCGILRLAHAHLARVKSINVKTGMYTTLRQEEQSRTSLGNSSDFKCNAIALG